MRPQKTRNIRNQIMLFTMLLMAASTAITQPMDTLQHVMLDEVSVTSNLKEDGLLRQQPVSVSLVGQGQLKDHTVSSIKQLGAMVPNLFIPNYGSRQTNAIYMRGIGSRIGTPSVGLYVDNVPYVDRTAFDIALMDAERVDVLRGPQSTLYGRNTMGGLIHVHTHNPMDYSGTDIHLGLASREWGRQLSVAHYMRPTEQLALSAQAFYEGNDGTERHSVSGQKVGGVSLGGGRIRTIWKATDRWTIDANVGYEYSDESAYPYYYTGATIGPETYAEQVGKLTANLSPSYRRSLLNASLNAEYRTDDWQFNAVTSWQSVRDRMMMDQDFIAADIYALEQRQQIHTINEELVMKAIGSRRWRWLTGVNVYGQWLETKAPVTFRQDGIGWLNTLIADKMKASPMPVVVKILDEALRFDNSFESPTMGAALFHQSTMKRLLGIEGLDAVVGLRLDYEHRWLDYDAWYAMCHSYVMAPRVDESYDLNNRLEGKLNDEALEVLPRASIQYTDDWGNVYATVSRGYRSGGYNVQGISEPMQQMMQTDMMKNVRDVTLQKVPPTVKDMVTQVFDRIITDAPIDIEGTCSYRPEYAMNYEVGTHLDLLSHRMVVDASAYWSQVKDLQLSRMSDSGLGRTVVNAGRSRTIGAELSILARPTDGLNLTATMGLSNARLSEYTTIDSQGNEVDCEGNHVPYMPNHTLHLDAAYTWSIRGRALQAVTLGADLSNIGRIYWDEQNTHSQDAYTLLGARLKLQTNRMSLTLWGKNLTQTSYNTFWFESMSRGYEQHGKPLQVGMTLTLHL